MAMDTAMMMTTTRKRKNENKLIIHANSQVSDLSGNLAVGVNRLKAQKLRAYHSILPENKLFFNIQTEITEKY